MLLVGYDAPIVQVLYLDKALREHTLLQAIARVNRPYTPEKKYGLIVDYCGITKQLQEALAIFNEDDIKEVLVPFDTEIKELKLRHAEAMSFFSDIKNKDDFDEIVVKFEPVNVREDFEYAFKMFSKSLDAVMPRPEADPFIDDFKNLSRIRQRLRNVYGGVGLSLKIEGNKVQQLIDDVIRSLKISTLIKEREITDETFLADVYKVAKTQKARTALVKNKARQIIDEKMHTNPAYYERMKERLENLIRDESLRRKENANYFNNYKEFLLELVETEKEIKKLGFKNTFEHAVYEELMRTTSSEKKLSKDITKQIAEKIEEETTLVGWKNKRSVEKRLNILIYDVIFAEFQKRTNKNNDNKFKEEIVIEDLTKKIIELAKRDL
jgi:type I restriction enzyme R subunit